MSASPGGARVEVDADAIRHNAARFVARTGVAVMAVVKADGYGHGARTAARAAIEGGATWIGVTTVDHAVRLRRAGIAVPALSWLDPEPVDFRVAAEHRVDVAVGTFAALRDAIAADGVPRIHLQLDTGLAREGFAPADWELLAARAARAERRGRIRVVGAMTHLSSADRPADPANAAARAAFARGLAVLAAEGVHPEERHAAGSAAALLDPASRGTLVRVGAGLVGIDATGGAAGLRGAMALRAPLVGVRRVPAGTPVGYGGTWAAPRDTILGLLPVGYADGLPRAASARASVALAGRRVPVAGVMSMNQTVVDLGPDARDRAGDEVVVLGAGSDGAPTARDWAAWAGTIPHEVLTSIGSAASSRAPARPAPSAPPAAPASPVRMEIPA
ncbi:alanine racemase [Clavibacter michiganensis]|uniref:alanine racemase n=1 Tax=Clavibacter michiganensis TaxID=28447 RepID=UPI0009B8D137|nr:alanine racemase [Clavibacter michiganensis]